MKELINELNKRVKFVEVLKHYNIKYDEREDRFRVICPFHSDHTPSLIVYTNNADKRDTWWCPPCATGGDVFAFIRKKMRQELGLDLDDKSDFSKSFEFFKVFAGYKEDGSTLKDDFYRKLEGKEEELAFDKNGTKKYLYTCGIIVRDAIKEKALTEREADRIFKRIDEEMDCEDVEKIEKLFMKVRDIIKRRKNVGTKNI